MTITRAESDSELAQGFKPRHVTMLSIAGVNGAGLSVGSEQAIAAVGPAAIVAYALAGALVVLVMRVLREMAVASPDTGSFSTYADHVIGRWAGFTIGWPYWWLWVLVIPIEAIAAGVVLNNWFPQVEAWFFALAQHSDLPIFDVALACGFISPSHFSKCYTAFYGYSPSKERRYECVRSMK